MKAARFYVRMFGLLSLIVGAAIVYDLVSSPKETDFAIVTGKAQFYGRYGSSNTVYAKGKYVYNEDVTLSFYNACRAGDTLELGLTPLGKEWRHVALVRNGVEIARSVGSDVWYMGLFGVAFLLVAFVSAIGSNLLTCNFGFLIGASFANLLALLLILKYVGVIFGVFEKM